MPAIDSNVIAIILKLVKRDHASDTQYQEINGALLGALEMYDLLSTECDKATVEGQMLDGKYITVNYQPMNGLITAIVAYSRLRLAYRAEPFALGRSLGFFSTHCREDCSHRVEPFLFELQIGKTNLYRSSGFQTSRHVHIPDFARRFAEGYAQGHKDYTQKYKSFQDECSQGICRICRQSNRLFSRIFI